MRWWNWLLLVTPPPLFAALVYANHDLPRSLFSDGLWLLIVSACLLLGQGGIAFTRLDATWRSLMGIVYSVLCPLTLIPAGLIVACATGDCI